MRDNVTVTPWVKSSYSNTGANCVETAHVAAGGMAVRDSKATNGPVIGFPAVAWDALVEGLAEDGR